MLEDVDMHRQSPYGATTTDLRPPCTVLPLWCSST